MKPTIADLLHRAADHWLAVDGNDYDDRPDTERFSCCAMSAAVLEAHGYCNTVEDVIMFGLEAMGLDTESGSVFSRLGYNDNLDHDTQGARYTWLKFAALIAEEQGV